MTETEEARQIRDRLNRVRLDWEGAPQLVDIRFTLGEDQTGDPAVFVTALLDDDTPEEKWTSEDGLDAISDRVREAVASVNDRRWVYVDFARPSDLNGVNGAAG